MKFKILFVTIFFAVPASFALPDFFDSFFSSNILKSIFKNELEFSQKYPYAAHLTAPLFYGIYDSTKPGDQKYLLDNARVKILNNIGAIQSISTGYSSTLCSAMKQVDANVHERFKYSARTVRATREAEAFSKTLTEQNLKKYRLFEYFDKSSWGLSQDEIDFIQTFYSYEKETQAVRAQLNATILPSEICKEDRQNIKFCYTDIELADFAVRLVLKNQALNSTLESKLNETQIRYLKIRIKMYSNMIGFIRAYKPSIISQLTASSHPADFLLRLEDKEILGFEVRSVQGFLMRRCVQGEWAKVSCPDLVNVYVQAFRTLSSQLEKGCD
jgi:hypothetical protein